MRRIASVLALPLLVAMTARATPPRDKPGTDKPATLAGETGEKWPMSLPDAIRIALDNSEIACVVYAQMPPGTVTELDRCDPGPFLKYQPYYEAPIGFADDPPRKAPIPGPLMIHRVKSDTPLWRFRAEAMALVRSVEQQYWALAAWRMRVGCAEQVVKAAKEVVEKEQGELTCRGGVADIVEAIQRLEHFQKVLKTRTARLAEADRGLRILLGLPHSDGRHIVTVTRPIDQPIACDLRDGDSSDDDGYRRYQQAKQHRIEAARRLEARKAWYEEGRITADRYLDAISQHAEAIAAEADRASGYNTSIAALGEAKGTLLADRFILVIDQPLRMPKNWVNGPDKPEEAVKKASCEGP